MSDFEHAALEEAIVTIRVINVPSHTTETEFNCWFLFAPGFEQATLVPTRGPNQSQLGWARFSTVDAAQAAIHQLNGRRLTEDQSPEGIVLTADFAKSNYRPSTMPRKRCYPSLTVGIPVQPQGPKITPPAVIAAPPRPKCSTLFLGGLQEGCTEHELHHLFQSGCAGFERLKFVPPVDGKPGMSFAKFLSPEHAEAALQTILMGVTLPSCPGFQLQAEFAKHDLDRPSKGLRQDLAAPSIVAPPYEMMHQQPRPIVPRPFLSEAATPCDTMFMGNLPPTVTEQELAGAVMTMPGFVRTKLVGQGQPRPVAFVLFDAVENCSEAIQALNGAALPSAPSQAMSCEFSKNSLDKRQRSA